MKRNILISLLGAFALLAMPQYVYGLNVGDDAPRLEIQEWIKGDAVSLNEAKGSIVLLEFWASW